MTTASTELPAYLKRLAEDRDWWGCLTLENLDLVADRLRRLLDGKRYTWAASLHWKGAQDDFVMPEVRAGMRVEEIKVSRGGWDDSDGDPHEMGHIVVSDTYGVWGIHTTVTDQQAAGALSYDEQRDRTSYLHFKGNRYGDQLQMEHFASSGNRICWVVAVEPDPEPGETP